MADKRLETSCYVQDYSCRRKVPGPRDARVRVVKQTVNCAHHDGFKAYTATPLNNNELWQQEKAYKVCRGPSAKKGRNYRPLVVQRTMEEAIAAVFGKSRTLLGRQSCVQGSRLLTESS